MSNDPLPLHAPFGFVLIKSEAASWYRIQEMFHFQSFHMFGILFSAIATGMLGIQLIKRMGARRSLDGQTITIPEKPPGRVSVRSPCGMQRACNVRVHG